ncbi:PD-(D/E)XK nuclease-like domain-containing protein [Bradyrhizobium sp. 174]|uniref:PD-(D/E)XK nuclease-like domain-containing protein n=1 Tax=Bradyrhizobium sp. 174 TaxID=2782645 RepID=UPI001FF80CA6|nr:PD-(D/E)XK nuclease-like domain-containing protein [Bradyrhizobium sp. 174]MCK1577870.1 PD-(D/E)XK nuclease-like domain-containing protein [Bradyrhizobium sp. 174]
MNALVSALRSNNTVRHDDGIYFGLDETTYHADEALGSTSLKELVLDPVEYQDDKLNPGEEKESMALKWGHAIHCRALEGRLSVAERFAIAPAVSDYKGALVTMTDLTRHCKTIGVKPGKTKAEAIAAIRDFDKEVQIWDEIQAKFEADNVGKEILPRAALDQIEKAVRWMQRSRKIAPVMKDGTFVAGASEVSIFYTENGVRLKARIDHLLAHAVVDLKSFRPFYRENIVEAAKKAVSRMRYDLQAGAYLKALRAAAALHAEGRVFNNPYPKDFLDEVFASLAIAQRSPAADDAMKWVWVMIKANGAPQTVVGEFDLTSMIFRQAVVDVERAIGEYRHFMEAFGPDQEWVREIPAQLWGDTDFSSWAFL